MSSRTYSEYNHTDPEKFPAKFAKYGWSDHRKQEMFLMWPCENVQGGQALTKFIYIQKLMLKEILV